MTALTYRFPHREFADWKALHDLLATSFAAMENRIDPPSSMTLLTPTLLAAKADEEMLLTVRDGAALIATAFVKPHGNWAYVGKVAVAESHRGRGVCRAMFERIATHATEAGWSYLELQTRVELTENHATFARLGFVKTCETAHPGFDHPTSITMQKRLGRSRAA